MGRKPKIPKIEILSILKEEVQEIFSAREK